MRSSLRFLYELFLRDARFPDEKFWNKSGEPTQMAKKSGPPPGATGTTAKDWGVKDDPKNGSSKPGRIIITSVDDPGDAEWFQEDEFWDRISDLSPEFPPDMSHDEQQEVYDAPWDHPDVIWIDSSKNRFKFSREKS